jgi:DNA-directed RNA polymerase alpha subunit
MRNSRGTRPTSHPLSELPLPRRAINALHHGGIHTLEDAAQWQDKALLALPQFGPAFLAALRRAAHRISET